jgi:hypothetical protein
MMPLELKKDVDVRERLLAHMDEKIVKTICKVQERINTTATLQSS